MDKKVKKLPKGTTSKIEDLKDLFKKDAKIYGKETKEIKQLKKEGFIKKGKDEKGVYFIKK